jgi:MoaA/NifB/PqqE/SkfB family radical SAM enzyme
MKYTREINNYYNPESKRINNLFEYYRNPAYQNAVSKETMPDFPFVSSLEFTNTCNLDCLFCARAVMTRPLGFMSPLLFDKIMAEYREHRTFIKINGYGENLLHPQALDFIKEIKKANGLYFTSNCTTLDSKTAACFVENQLDVLQVSFQGVDRKSYEEQRRKSSFANVINNIKNLINIRGNLAYPFIHLSTTILDESEQEIEGFIEMGFELGVDSVGIGRTDYGRVIEAMIGDAKRKRQINAMKKRQSLIKIPDHTYLYKYIDVNWDGIVVSSFFDFNEFVPVGDLHNNTMHEIWNHSEVLNALRVLEKHQLLNNMKVFDTFYHAWHGGNSSYNLADDETLKS